MQTIQRAKRFGSIAILAVVGLLLAYALNSLVFHWQLPFSHTAEAQITPAGPTEIIRIEPIVLDCRARITANVPVEGKKDYRASALGVTQTYRTDKMKLVATGDVDTCVEGGADIQELKNGGWIVTVNAADIKFNRPRVDTVATADSVDFSKGWVGKLTDAFPWVDESNGLTPAGYAYAQTVIGGSSCMEAAWQPTQAVIRAAYEQQAVAKHIDPAKVQVIISGEPDFKQHDADMDESEFRGFTFKVDAAKVKCEVHPDALKPE